MHLKERSHTQSEPTFTILASQSLYIILFYVFAALLSPSWDIWEKALKDLINHPLLDFTLLLHASCYLMSCLLPFLPIVSFVSCYLLTSSREESVMIQIDNYLRSLFSITSVKVNHTFLTLKTATQLCLFAFLLLQTRKFPVIIQERRHPLWSQGLDSFLLSFFLFWKELCGCVKPCIYSVKFVF